jgi:CRP-like cAMP-binding protein
MFQFTHSERAAAMSLDPLADVPQAQGNRLLAALPAADLASMAPLLETVRIEVGAILCEPGEPISHIYFPDDCLVSQLAVAEGRLTLEIGLVGREGMLGATVALGHDLAQVRAIVQRGGYACRVESALFRAEFTRNASLQRILYRYTDSLLVQAIQIAVCSRFHMLEARLARSLLITRDRLKSDKFHLTHEFLAHALGVRRVGVTKAASALQQHGLIVYSRGNIEIVDLRGLEAISCTCYNIVKNGGDSALASAFD